VSLCCQLPICHHNSSRSFPLILAGFWLKYGLCLLLWLRQACQILQFYSCCHPKAFIIFSLASKGQGKWWGWQGFLLCFVATILTILSLNKLNKQVQLPSVPGHTGWDSLWSIKLQTGQFLFHSLTMSFERHQHWKTPFLAQPPDTFGLIWYQRRWYVL
jgi:hypothetical protein